MDREQFARLQSLFEELCDAPDERRRSALADLQGRSPELAAALARLLRNDSGSADRLDSLKGGLGHIAWSALQDPGPLPEQIADFKVLGLLGSGGMGTVYRAEQKSPRRLVALKVLRAGATAPASLARFELEAEVLGRLQHPGIAQIFSAGTAALGRLEPYFAMELVEGETLTSYVRTLGLALRERVELLIDIATALHHAHQKGVIHRDLKPANILVTESGQPKILDFGVARLLERDAASGSDTMAGQLVGTLAYMSPEQVAGRIDAIDTRADIYAIGVIAYEVLGGRSPYHLDGRPLPEAARVVCEREPPRLGTLARELRGDLETIVAKALEKDPARRYESAHDLAADLRRFLRHEPIEARVPSALDRSLKFARRHRGLVTGIGVACLAIIAGVVGLSLATARARRAEAHAQELAASEHENAAIATATHELLDRVLSAPDPWLVDSPDARNVKVVDLLGRADEELNSFHGSLAVEAAVRSTLGRTYSNLSEYDRALPQLTRAFELAGSLWGGDDRRTIALEKDLASLHLDRGDYDKAEPLARACVADCERMAGDGDEATTKVRGVLLGVLRGRHQMTEATELARRTYERARETLGEDADATIGALHNLAAIELEVGQPSEAERMVRVAVEARSRTHGEEHPQTLASLGLLCEVLWQQGRLLEAQKIARKVLAAFEKRFGPEHTRTLTSMNTLATLLADADQLREALALREELLEIARRKLGAEHPLTLHWTYGKVSLLHRMMRWDDAEKCCRDLIEVQRRVDPGNVLDSLNFLATILCDDRRPKVALPVFDEVLQIALSSSVPSWRLAMYHANHANCLLRLDRFEEAEAELADCHAELERELGPQDDHTQYALAKLILTYESMGQKDLASELREQLTPHGRLHAAKR